VREAKHGGPRGRALLDHLTRLGVHSVHVSLDGNASTGAAVIQVDEEGQKQILAALGANLLMKVADVEAAAETIRVSRVLVAQLEVPVECVNAAIRIAAEAGVRVVFDPAPPVPLPDDLLARVDVIRANKTEVEALTGIRIVDQPSAREGARALVARRLRRRDRRGRQGQPPRVGVGRGVDSSAASRACRCDRSR
jgi:ribokinase